MADIPMDIFYKIISYLNDIIIQDRKKVGWKEINEEVHLFSEHQDKWQRNKALYKSIRWTVAGYKIIESEYLPKMTQIYRIRRCQCGTTTEDIPYICKLRDCMCGHPKQLELEMFTCNNCGINPRKMWTMPL